MRLHFPLLTLAAALALGAPAAPALAQDRGAAQVAPPRVGPEWKLGVVDLAQVFKQYKRSSDLEQKINDERDRGNRHRTTRGDLV